jgi:subtilisin family serine protease
MLDLFVRVLLLLILLGTGAGSVVGIWYLLNPSKALRVSSFEVIHGADSKKSDSEILAALLVSRINRINSILATDLKPLGPPDEIRAESVIKPEFRSSAGIQPRIEAEFKPLEFDVAGLVNRLLEILHDGPLLNATVLNKDAENGVEILASYTESGEDTLGPWAVWSDKGVGEGVDQLANQIVLDSHRRHASQLGNLTVPQFASLISSLEHYQQYVSEDQKANSDPASNFHLTRAAEQLKALADEKVPCGLVYSYLGSIDSIVKDETGAEENFRIAVKLDPQDGFSVLALGRRQLKPRSLGTHGTLEAVRAQTGFDLMHVGEAIKAAETGQPVQVAILAAGVSPVGGIKLIHGKAFRPGSPDSDPLGDGTQVAALITAISPNTEIIPIKIMDDRGTTTTVEVLHGIDYAIDLKTKHEPIGLIVLPFWTESYSIALHQAIQYARLRGILVVAPAGNDGSLTSVYPAADSGVIGIGSTDQKDRRATFSNYGPSVKLAAPGVDLVTLGPDGNLWKVSGTTFSSAEAAGIGALLLSVRPQLRVDEVENIMRRTAVDLKDQNLGAGRLDALAALSEAIRD